MTPKHMTIQLRWGEHKRRTYTNVPANVVAKWEHGPMGLANKKRCMRVPYLST